MPTRGRRRACRWRSRCGVAVLSTYLFAGKVPARSGGGNRRFPPKATSDSEAQGGSSQAEPGTQALNGWLPSVDFVGHWHLTGEILALRRQLRLVPSPADPGPAVGWSLRRWCPRLWGTQSPSSSISHRKKTREAGRAVENLFRNANCGLTYFLNPTRLSPRSCANLQSVVLF
jgi:hypothetical protein